MIWNSPISTLLCLVSGCQGEQLCSLCSSKDFDDCQAEFYCSQQQMLGIERQFYLPCKHVSSTMNKGTTHSKTLSSITLPTCILLTSLALMRRICFVFTYTILTLSSHCSILYYINILLLLLLLLQTLCAFVALRVCCCPTLQSPIDYVMGTEWCRQHSPT